MESNAIELPEGVLKEVIEIAEDKLRKLDPRCKCNYMRFKKIDYLENGKYLLTFRCAVCRGFTKILKSNISDGSNKSLFSIKKSNYPTGYSLDRTGGAQNEI